MFDSVLLITVLVILGLAVVGAVLRARRRDICLKSFSGYLVYLRMKDGKQVWGQLRSEATGIELSYRQDHFDNDGHIESSYVVFKSEYPNIHLLVRFKDELTERNARRRERTLKRSYRPNPARRARRRVRNAFNLLRDAFSQALTAVIAAASKTGPAGVASQQKTMGQTGTELVEWFGNAYDPILEHHIGRRVVLEVKSPEGQKLEYVGVFREYSPDYLEVMDVNFVDGGMTRQVDLLIPRAHGVVRHAGEPVGVKVAEPSIPRPALLDDPSEPETTVAV